MPALRQCYRKPHLYLTVLLLVLAAACVDAARPPDRQYGARAYVSLVRGYQRVCSPALSSFITCRFTPSCSEYSAQAVRTQGIVKGLCWTVARLARCTSSVPAGTKDPVEEPGGAGRSPDANAMEKGDRSVQSVGYNDGQVPLPDGGQLAYYERKAAGPALVLIPGSWGDFHVFDHIVPVLEPSLHLVIVELRGHGGSWPPAPDASIELFAEDVLRVVDHLGLQRFYVGGHSIGGMIPIEIAKRRPEAVAGVIAIEGWTHHRAQADAFGKLPPTVLPPEEQQALEETRARIQSKLTKEQIDNFATAWKKWDGLPILESTNVPVLELWGDRGAGPQPLAALRIPQRANIEVHWIAGASHWMLITKSGELATLINDWLKRMETQTAHGISSK